MPTWLLVPPSKSRRRHGVPAKAMLFAQVFNVLALVSSLAFGDRSVRAFKAAVSLVDEGGLLVYNPKKNFFAPLNSVGGFEGAAADGNGFSGLIHTAVDKGYSSIVAKRRYCHRCSVTNESLYCVAVVVVKNTTLH